jgi:F420-0:gamma-glutamyl ligase
MIESSSGVVRPKDFRTSCRSLGSGRRRTVGDRVTFIVAETLSKAR